MALTFKTKPASQQTVGEAITTIMNVPVHKPTFKKATEQQLKVDELVQIDQKMKELNVDLMVKRREELRKELQSIAQLADPEEEVKLEGMEGYVLFSKASVKLEFQDQNALVEKLTPGVFNLIAKVSVTDAKKYLSENEIANIAAKSFGSRTLKAVMKND